ncbi:MAG TPA: M23 family metallopeptidase [Chitinivibrionales bacterium]|nr:M23 family metallopeptidase [Chitinivibrionales bacterium]
MKKPAFSLLFVNSCSSSKVRRVPLNRAVIGIFFTVLLLGTLGLGRCIYFATSYGFARLDMHFNLNENAQLKKKINFYSKYAHEEGSRLNRIIGFEDKVRLHFGMEQISDDVRKVGVGGRPSANDLIIASLEDPSVMKTDSIKENILTLLRQAHLEDTTFGKMAVEFDRKFDLWSQRPAISPVGGRLTSGFGYRIHPFTGYNVFHEGIDISNLIGTPIHATADGIVSYVGYKTYFGNVVEISHPASGFKTVFGHLNKGAVVLGQVIKRGELIGYMGNSGRSTGPHLHYEVRQLSTVQNPLQFILPTDTMVD